MKWMCIKNDSKDLIKGIFPRVKIKKNELGEFSDGDRHRAHRHGQTPSANKFKAT